MRLSEKQLQELEDGLFTSSIVLDLVKEVRDLRDRLLWIECLENAGIDNWEGYDYACELYHGYE